MTIEQKIKEIEGFVERYKQHSKHGDWRENNDFTNGELVKQALEVIRELQADNIILKARLQPTPEAPEIDKITCLEADVALRDDKIEELEKQLDRVKDKQALYNILVKAEMEWSAKDSNENLFNVKTQAIQNYILGGEGGN